MLAFVLDFVSADMIDHCCRPTKPIVPQLSATTVRCHGNSHDVTSFLSTSRDAGQYVIGDALEHVQMSDVVAESTMPRSSRAVDDYELAADAEVRWLLRHVAAATPLTPEIEPALGGLRIGGDEASLMASEAPDFDSLRPYLATIPAPYCDLHLPSRTVCRRDSRRRPCLNFDKMQV